MSRLWPFLSNHARLSALAFGFLSATGFQPLGLWPLALAAMGAFAGLIAESRDARQAAWLGWLFGWAHFTFGNNWIATAFTHQAEMPAVLGWAAVPLLSLYLAFFPAVAALGARAMAGQSRPYVLALALAGCWVLSEFLRARVFTGYAWNPFAMVLLGPFDRPGLAALSPWMGTYALSGLAVFFAAALAALLRYRRYVAAVATAALIAAGMYLPAPAARQGTVRFTLVQPDLPQDQLSNPLYWEANFVRLAQLSPARAPAPGASFDRLVLWPESGLVDYLRPGYPQRYYDRTTSFGDPKLARERIGRLIGTGSVLLTGAVDLEIEDDRAAGAYNAVTALDSSGGILGGYRKAHLVPYGEYLPMRPLLEPIGLSRLVAGSIDFIPGPGPQTLDLGPLGKAGIQVCYEIVFSGEVVDRHNRPDYIFNPSNDGWFGNFGPPQHLAQARMRAIEEGLPVLRATTTGISAVIDPHGVVRRHFAQMRGGRIDGTIPQAEPPTLFARLGDWLPLAWALLANAAALIASRRTAR